MSKEQKPEYNTVTIEAAVNAWILREKGRPVEVFHRWDLLTNRLKERLARQEPHNE